MISFLYDHRWQIGITLFCLLLGGGLYWWQWGPLQRLRLYSMDMRARLGAKTPQDERLVYLGFSPNHSERFMEDVERSEALKLMSQQWPWSREIWGLATRRLVKAGADVVLLDLLLESPRPGDDALKAVMDTYPKRVVLGSRLDYQQMAGTSMVSYIPPADSIISQAGELEVAMSDGRVGHVNLWPDGDGVVRSIDYRSAYYGQSLYALASRGLQRSGHAGKIPQHAGPVMIRFGPVGSDGYRMFPFYQIFVDSIWTDYFQGGDFFQDKIVIIGPYGNWQHDVHRTPMSDQPVSGPRIHLHAVAAGLHGEFLSMTSRSTDWALIVLFGLLALGIALGFEHTLIQSVALVGVNVGYLAVTLIFYNSPGLYLPAVAPLIPLDTAVPGIFLYEFIREQREKARVRSTLDRYISTDVAAEILEDREDYYDSLGGVRKPVTVLFSDVRGFTTLSENLEPEDLVHQLNEYLTPMVENVQSRRGRLDKFIGDAVMAVWGDLFQNDNRTADARLAVDAALGMIDDLDRLNSEWAERDMPQLSIGIGINHGEAVFGNLGADQRMELTVLGDAVNLASRLEGLTKQYNLELLISQNVADLVKEEYLLQRVDRVRVKGKTKPTTVYTVVCRREQLEDGRPLWLKQYETAFKMYQNRKFEQAHDQFETCMDRVPEPTLCRTYMERCEQFMQEAPDEDWDGVFVMKTK